ncbi:hypothetical protein CEE37_11945 [candidate division LCP-89 bacterium B3_LCP]|uniref:LamG-like jellyroll fold domain-containing protein n=1 Tax=candidate division LCP-89 bacterium B3_LCP TaxID=2012998 RepID=A0A532UW11_UNCL8|nr:MAG: hypothetical protein CEE37_11945 [candidate division LCP-89 bacterium B3_LCP]
MTLTITYRLVVIIAITLFQFSSLNAQERYALDASQGCWGEVPADPNLDPPDSLSGEAWVFLHDDAQPEQTIFRSNSTTYPGDYALKIVNGHAVFELTIDGLGLLEATGATPLPLGAWAHLACSYGIDGIHLFLNGMEDAFAAGTGSPSEVPGPILFGGSGDPGEQLNGLIDDVSIGGLRFTEEFDPFKVPLFQLIVDDDEIPGWTAGIDPWDYGQAWDDSSLWDLINGAGIPYMENNFQYFLTQNYDGQVYGFDEEAELLMTDQGTGADARAVFDDPLIAPGVFTPIDTIGVQARLVVLLWDLYIDFWQDNYYCKVTVGFEFENPQAQAEAEQVAAQFCSIVDNNIITRFDNIAALWKFDEGIGSTFYDATGHGFDGTLQSPAWSFTIWHEPVMYVTSAELLEGVIQSGAIDDDDTVRVTFSEAVDPIEISADNIDEALTLSGGHSWLSGSGEMGAATWSGGLDTLLIALSLNGGEPTLANGDTLTPNSDSLTSGSGLAVGGYRFIRFEEVTGIGSETYPGVPHSVVLHSPHPNPFNASMRITYDLPSQSDVKITMWDLSGREVNTIYEGIKSSGRHHITMKADHLPSGIYLITLDAGTVRLVQKAVLIK